MRVKAIKSYNDLELKRLVITNEELNVADARGTKLVQAGVAVEIPTTTPEVAIKPVAKKATTRKKNVEG